MSDHTIAETCSALGEPVRWSILELLGNGDASASALARALPISRQSIARHLNVLEASGLVTAERHGREVQYRVVSSELTRLAKKLEDARQAWDARLEAIRDISERLS